MAVDAEARLMSVVSDPQSPPIVRATAVSLLGHWLDSQSGAAIERAPRAIPIRCCEWPPWTSLSALPRRCGRALVPLLANPVRAVRIEAARALALTPEAALSPGDLDRRNRGVAEWEATQRFNADSAGAHVNLGTYYLERGDAARAEAEYRTARRLEPYFAPAAVNLADLYRTSRS